MISGHTSKKSDQVHSVNFNLAGSQAPFGFGGDQQPLYEGPTLKRLNPELYKEQANSKKQVVDPQMLSVKNIKERHGYYEMRVQRIQKRTEELTKELGVKNDEQILKTRKKNLKGTSEP